ncbi:MAG TPA: AMP-binding protein, partial [Nitrolancea sp.]|nr:AMP-binding protein [Nitrolancea sp.]
FVGGRFLTKWPERIPYPVTVSFGSPVPSSTPAHELRRLVLELGEAAWQMRKSDRRPLHRAFIAAMRRYPFRLVMADQTKPHLSALQTLIGSIAMARALKSHWQEQQHVGLLLPPTVAAGLSNLAATMAGRTSVNLNYTVGKHGLESAVRQANLRTIVTSRKFVEKAKLDLPDGPRILWLEDIAATIGGTQKAIATILALLAPMSVIERLCGQREQVTMDHLATIIFSSGSTGDPKGVMLSHFNIDSNVQAVSQVLPLETTDRVLGILPLFHSFGYLVFWYVTLNGAATVFHPSPLDVTAIGELCAKHRLTFLVCTPTFLQLYQRRCSPEQFSTLRVVLTGAEKLSARLCQSFEDRFGIAPIEGYGVTECAPVIAVNCPDFRATGFFQPASRRGTVGRPLPGVSARIVDPDSFNLLPVGAPGMLLVKGPNVMQGYLGREDLTAQVIRSGWYITGDIASLDDDGFLTITDRLSRFSKIGGEMVPHRRVEEALQLASGEETQVCAVTGVPDARRGEQLAVLHTLEEGMVPQVIAKAAASGLPNLFVPSRSHFIKVDTLPLLGTGKLDLRALKRIAMERLGTEEA